MKKSSAKNQSATDRVCVNTIRTLAMDAVQAAKSGHPGPVVERPGPETNAGGVT